MKTILFDDVGSYPLPKGVDREWINQAVQNNDPRLPKIIKDAMQQKVDAGIDVPTYPQFREW
jgi:5-methyltetrahydropteroyltriglutamate--homocysteine methyltransferase